MIARIAGTIDEVTENSILLATEGGIGYEILVPAAEIEGCTALLGKDIVFHTIHVIEGDPSRGQMQPRLIGFTSESDREFFKAFTKVKGIGIRKALRSLVRPFVEIASAIEAKDAKLLTSLPEIGKRTAETIIAELNGKVEEFAADTAVPGSNTVESARHIPQAGQEAISALVQLGEKRSEAELLVERVLAVAPEIDTTEEIIQHVYRLKL